jgi:hypothetical protein
VPRQPRARPDGYVQAARLLAKWVHIVKLWVQAYSGATTMGGFGRCSMLVTNAFRRTIQVLLVDAFLLVTTHHAWATPTVSITNVSPNPIRPGGNLTVTLASMDAPTGCTTTLIPYGQGNVPSIVSLKQPPPAPPRSPLTYNTFSIAIPSTLQCGQYALQVVCDSVAPLFVQAEKDVTIGPGPVVSTFGPPQGQIAQSVTVNGTCFGPSQGQGYVELVATSSPPIPNVYVVNGVTSWSNTQITFTVPEYASIGSYNIIIQTSTAGMSPPAMGFSIGRSIIGWFDLHAHLLGNLGFGGKFIYGAVDDKGSQFVLGPPGGLPLPPGTPYPPGLPCPRNPTTSEGDALGQEYSVHGLWDPVINPCGDNVRPNFLVAFEQQLGAHISTYDALPPVPLASFGYPNFNTWPTWDDLVDQRMYWSWVKRAWQGGQRVMVALAVNSKLIADVSSGPGDGPDDDKGSADVQIQAIKQFTLNHSDFMQLALSSNDLWNAVANNKMAVVIGVEIDNIGDLVGPQPTCSDSNASCTCVPPNKPDPATCANASNNPPACPLIREIDHLYCEGVRYIFPIHLVDNPIGSTAMYTPMFNVANVYEEGAPNAMKCACGVDYQYTAPGWILNAASVRLGPNMPSIPPTQTCQQTSMKCPGVPGPGIINGSSSPLTRAGQDAISYMMSKHMLIDVDHMSDAAARATIALANAHSPYKYPLNSGHNGVRATVSQPGVTISERALAADNYAAIGTLHGMAGIGSAKATADQWANLYYRTVFQAMPPGAVGGFGTDFNGLEFAMPPRSGASVKYGGAFLTMSADGTQTWNYNGVGVAHYGLLPDFLQDVQSLPAGPFPGAVVVNNMNSGAQYFWETWRIAEGVPPAPPPPTQPAVSWQPNSNACPGVQQPTGVPASFAGSVPRCSCPANTSLDTTGECVCVGAACGTPGAQPWGGSSGGPCNPACKYGCLSNGTCSGPKLQTGGQ